MRKSLGAKAMSEVLELFSLYLEKNSEKLGLYPGALAAAGCVCQESGRPGNRARIPSRVVCDLAGGL